MFNKSQIMFVRLATLLYCVVQYAYTARMAIMKIDTKLETYASNKKEEVVQSSIKAEVLLNQEKAVLESIDSRYIYIYI